MNAEQTLARVRIGMAAPALDRDRLAERSDAIGRAAAERIGTAARIRRDQEFLNRLSRARKDASNG